MKLKHCPKCDENKEILLFYSDKTKNDGKDALCKDCRVIANRKYGKECRKKWFVLNPEKRRLYWKTDREKHPTHRAARNAVRAAILKGELIKPKKCQQCLTEKPYLVGDHYKGYAKENWLKVQFICRDCDGERRRKRL